MQFGRGKPSAGVFFDSDFSDLDSILAVAVLYGLQGKNDCRMAVITTSRPDLATVGYIDMVERFYHGPGRNFAQVPPVGMRTEGKPGVTPAAFVTPFAKKKADGTAVYTNQVKSVIDTGDPNTLFRNYLEAQYDQNAYFVLAGPATNLGAALDFRGMKDLIAAKIKYLVVAGGAFPEGPVDARFRADIPAARRVFAEWPTPIVVAGREVGASLEFPGASIDKEFAAAVPDNPVADAYRAWNPGLGNTPTWATAAALYAGRPKEGYFKVSEPGTVSVLDDGRTEFRTSANGRHRYLIFDPLQREKIVQTYVELASAKPVIRLRFRPDAAEQQKLDPAEKVIDPLK
jgi:inosine-uridine nucleoside N-ribohydrolase